MARFFLCESFPDFPINALSSSGRTKITSADCFGALENFKGEVGEIFFKSIFGAIEKNGNRDKVVFHLYFLLSVCEQLFLILYNHIQKVSQLKYKDRPCVNKQKTL